MRGIRPGVTDSGHRAHGLYMAEKFLCLLLVRHNPCKSDAGFFERAAQRRQLADPLAHQGLIIDGTFAGDDQVCILDVRREVRHLGKELEPRLKFRSEEGPQSKSQTTRRSRAGFVSGRDV